MPCAKEQAADRAFGRNFTPIDSQRRRGGKTFEESLDGYVLCIKKLQLETQ